MVDPELGWVEDDTRPDCVEEAPELDEVEPKLIEVEPEFTSFLRRISAQSLRSLSPSVCFLSSVK